MCFNKNFYLSLCFESQPDSLFVRVSRALGMAPWSPQMESPRWADRQESIELQSTGDAEGQRLSQNGTARLLRRPADYEARYSGYSALFGACFMAESRALGIKWISSDLPLIGGAWRGKTFESFTAS